MAPANPLAGLPKGTFPVNLSPALEDALHPEQVKKRKRAVDEMVALRYNFKPNSITRTTAGVYTSDGSSKRVSFDVGGGIKQVFEAQEETSRVRECVMLWNSEAKAFTMHPISATYQLTLSRGLSGPSKPTAPAAPASVASTTSSGSSGAPLARRKSKPAAAPANVQTPPKVKKSKPEDLTPTAPAPGTTPRSTKGGKSLPRKTISTPTFANTPRASSPAPIPTPSAPPKAKPKAAAKGKTKAKSAPSATAKEKATGKKAAPKKPAGAPKGKFKSAEIIEDEDDGDGESLDDEFARMVGESIAAAQPSSSVRAEYEEDDDEEDEDSEDDELGGAKLVGGSGDGDSEWL